MEYIKIKAPQYMNLIKCTFLDNKILLWLFFLMFGKNFIVLDAIPKQLFQFVSFLRMRASS